jgi:roadblock/LC7 domain-containing protein
MNKSEAEAFSKIPGRSISFRPSLNWAYNDGSEIAILLVHI